MEKLFQNQTKIWTPKQGLILTKSLTIAGIMFIMIAAIGYGMGILLTNFPMQTTWLYSVSVIILLGTMFSSFYIFSKIQTVKRIVILSTMLFYVLAEGIAFGMLFAAFGIEHPENLILIFAFGGLVALVAGMIGRLMSLKAALTLGKILIAASIGLMIVLFISMFFFIFQPAGFLTLYTGLYILMAFLFVGYIAYDVKIISSMSTFVSLEDNNIQNNYTLVFAYKLLMDLVGLVWTIAILFARNIR